MTRDASEDRLRELEERLAAERAAREESERVAEEAIRTLFARRREVELLGRVATLANGIEDPQEALRQIVSAICAHAGWPVGHAYAVAEGRLRSTGVWVIADPERFGSFRRRTEAMEFAPGAGLPGRVLATSEPTWVTDVAGDALFMRAEAALAAGLSSAFAFPLLAGAEVVGVLEFLSPEAHEPDRLLLGLMGRVGLQAGRVVERSRSREELERSNADLEQFAYRISHDLQEPLRTIVAFAELLERRHAAALEGDAREFMDFITDGARRMQAMVAGLLAFSRAGRFEADEEVDMGAVVAGALAGLQSLVEERGARVAVADGLPTVRGAAGPLGEVVQNLISNALRFSAAGDGPPVVEVAAEAREGEWRFSVADRGIGIEPRQRERVFEVFQRLHTREEYEGLGLGLAVTRRIVERHGGRIWVEANEPRGSVFRFTLPR